MEQPNQEPIDIILTDIRVHSSKTTNPQSFQRKIEKSLKSKAMERCLACKTIIDEHNKISLAVNLPAEISGRKIRYFMPQDGLPVIAGEDILGKITSLKKKR